MKIANTVPLTLCLLCLLFQPGTKAFASEQEVLQQLIQQQIQDVLAVVKAGKANYNVNPTDLNTQVSQLLENVIDFRSISRNVMGKYADQATAEQITQFQNTLRHTMLDFYTKSLVSFEPKNIEVLPLTASLGDKTTINMEVVSRDNTRYKLAYTMTRDQNTNLWLIRNMIVNGVNLGLVYRNQFYSLMSKTDSTLDNAMANWQIPTT